MIMLPGRSDDKMLENDAFLPPQVMALSSSSFMLTSGFKGLLNTSACEMLVKKLQDITERSDGSAQTAPEQTCSNSTR
jgi:hypothetical protein